METRALIFKSSKIGQKLSLKHIYPQIELKPLQTVKCVGCFQNILSRSEDEKEEEEEGKKYHLLVKHVLS